MTLPLVVVAAGAVVAGWIGLPAVFGGSQFAHWLEPVSAHGEHQGSHAAELGLMGISIAVAAAGVIFAYLMYYRAALSPEPFVNNAAR